MHLQAWDVVQPMYNSMMQVLLLMKFCDVWTPCPMIQRKFVVIDVKWYGNMLHLWEQKTGMLALLKFKDSVESRSVLEENKEETERTEGRRSWYSIHLLFLDQFRCVNKLPSVDHDDSSRKSTGHSPEQHVCQGLRPSVTWQRVPDLSLFTN